MNIDVNIRMPKINFDSEEEHKAFHNELKVFLKQKWNITNLKYTYNENKCTACEWGWGKCSCEDIGGQRIK